MEIPIEQYGNLLSKYLKTQKIRVVMLAIALLSSIALQILNPQLLGHFIDTAVAGGATETLVTTALAFIGVAVLTQFMTIWAAWLSEKVSWTAITALCIDLAEHCLNLDLTHHKSRTPGEWVQRIDGDVVALARFFSKLIVQVLGNGILVLGILIILLFEDWRAGLILSLFSCLSLLILLRIQRFAVAPWIRYRQKSAEFFGLIAEQIAGREDLRGNGTVSYVMQRFYKTLQSWLPLYHQARLTSTYLWGSAEGLFTLGNALSLVLSAYLWQRQAITLGNAYLIFHYTNLLRQPIDRVRQELQELQQVEANVIRIGELFQLRPRLPDPGEIPLPSSALSIIFNNVWFSYKTSYMSGFDNARGITDERRRNNNQKDWILQDVSFTLSAGKILGILGHTGSGKSTIARLLLRFYDIDRGTIRLGNIAINRTSISELRERVEIVTQDVQLFQASIRDNLTLFDSDIDDEEILSTLELLGITDWLRELPQGLDTILDPDSSSLSAGQAQLLSFARVFLKDPGLVILDEASSRLDPKTEMLIERATDKLLEHRTTIIIAHRLKTVQRADQILILERGKVAEYGDRATLAQDSHSRFSSLLKLNKGF